MVRYLISKDGNSTYLHNFRGKSPTETYSEVSAKEFGSKAHAESFIKRNGLGDSYSVEELKTGIDKRNG